MGGLETLETVSVPPPFEPIFLRAQDYVRRYFSERVEKPDQSTITISGERYILVRAASMSVEFFDLVMSLYQDEGPGNARAVATNILFDLAHAMGRADARSFHRKMGVHDPVEMLSAGPVHFAFAGWAFVRIFPESRPTPDDDYYLIYDHPFSFESDAWVTRGRKSEVPVCVMSSGYSSGWCEESFGFPLVAAEVECLAAGSECCRFIMAPPSRIEEHLERYVKETSGASIARSERGAVRVTVPEFFQRKRMEDELRRHQENLERRVEARTAELLATNELLRGEITERKRTEQQLRLLGSAVQNADEGIVIMKPASDAAGPRIVFVNNGFSRMTGLSSEEAVGSGLSAIGVAASDRETEESLDQNLALGKAFRGEMTAHRKDGSSYALELHVMPIQDMVEGLTHWIGILRDVSERARQLAALEHQALHDALTDLPNRILLQDRLDQALLTASRTKASLALLFMDLDRFKEVNDTFGHQSGDQLLREVGARLRAELRATDSVSRLGGDEFAVLLPFLDDVEGAILAAQKILKALQRPFVVEGQVLDVGASIGIALCPEHGTDAATLMRRADVAMYAAKHAASGYAVYSKENDPHSAGRLALIADLKRALADGGQLELHYQPVVRLAGRRVERVEALVRWRHPQLGLLGPDRFIVLAESSGVIDAITTRVLTLACRQCREWRDAGLPVGVAVNIAARNLQDTRFPGRVADVLSAHGLPASALALDLTEGSLAADPLHAIALLSELRAMGLSLAIDDFGTGYFSLTHLKQLPVTEIKIDRSFIQEMRASESDTAIVRATIDLSHAFGHAAVAEGVEDEATCRLLEHLGCDFVQGYHLTPPLAADELAAWLRAGPWGVGTA